MSTGQYGRQEYWEERYMNKKEGFDWYQGWDGIKDIITQFISTEFAVLHAGCGSSKIPFEMQNEGYKNITNCDFSRILIEDMLASQGENNMQWHIKDVKTMDYPNGSFNAVIEKGLLDSILCGDRSRIMAQRMLNQVHRVLTQGGIYISITHAKPDDRIRYFDEAIWKIKHFKVSKPRISSMPGEEEGLHYAYVCIKK